MAREKNRKQQAAVEGWPLKAYKNLAFLNSPAARQIRILCELIEPQNRFRKARIRDTIVFFGSARDFSREGAEKRLEAAEALVQKYGEGSPEVGQEYKIAKNFLRLSTYYDDAVELAERLTTWSMGLQQRGRRFVICSGGGPGIMEAANRGAHNAGGYSVGLNISLPMEQVPNPYQTHCVTFNFHYFFIRKFWFFYLAKALVIFPGGYGTLDELFQVLTLVQTGKTRKVMPIVLYGSEYWDEVMNLKALVEWGTICPDDLHWFRTINTVDEAFDYLTAELTARYLQ